MALITVNKENKVKLIHFKPELLNEEQKQGMIEVNDIPKKENSLEKVGFYVFNPKTKKVEVKYRDRTQEEIDRIKERKEKRK